MYLLRNYLESVLKVYKIFKALGSLKFKFSSLKCFQIQKLMFPLTYGYLNHCRFVKWGGGGAWGLPAHEKCCPLWCLTTKNYQLKSSAIARNTFDIRRGR